MRIVNLKWDTEDNKTGNPQKLPQELEVPKNFTIHDAEAIAEWLSETYDCCVDSFDLETS